MDEPARPLEWPELIFTLVFLAVAAVSWTGITLAELGAFRGTTLLAGSLLLSGVGFWLAIREFHRQPPRLVRPSWLWLGSLATTIAAACVLFAHPGQNIFEGYDASVYLAIGRSIEQSGGIIASDPILTGLPADARESLFPRDANWPRLLNRFPGGMQIAEGRDLVIPGFFHLLPVWIAILWKIGGPESTFFVNTVFGVLAVTALSLLGRRLLSPVTGAVAAALLVVNFGEIWFARNQFSEMLAQFLVVAGLYFTILALDLHLRVAGWSAGVAFGLSAQVRIDGLFLLPVVLVLLALTRRTHALGRAWPWFLTGAVIVGGHAAAHALLVAAPYTLRLITRVSESVESTLGASSWIAPGVLLVALIFGVAVAAVALRANWTSQTRCQAAMGATLAVTLSLGLLAPGVLPSLVSLLTPLGLVTSAAGLALLVVRQPGPRIWLVIAIFAAQWLLFFAWRESTMLPADFRRYVPIVLPLAMLFTGYLVASLASMRSAIRHAAWLVPIGLGALFLTRSAPIIRTPPMRDAYAALEAVAGRTDPDAIVLSDRSVPSHLSLALRYSFGRQALRIMERERLRPALRTLLGRALDDGRSAYVLIGRYEGEVPRRLWRSDLMDFDVRPVAVTAFRYTILAPTRATFPSQVRVSTDRLELCRIFASGTARAMPIPAVIDLGDADFPYLLNGFYGPESILGSGARWTMGQAALWLPPIAIAQSMNASLTVRAFAYRPPGIEPPAIELSIDDLVIGRIASPAPDFGSYRFELDSHVSNKLRETGAALAIRTKPFSPKDAGISEDTRQLGVAVDQVRIE